MVRSAFALLFVVLPLHLWAAVFKAVDAPPATVVQSKVDSATSAITRMYFSEEVPLAPGLSKVKTGVDLVQLEVDQIEAFIKARGRPENKKITYVRYTSGDLRLANALIHARQAGITVEILIDLNPVLTTEAGETKDFTNDFRHVVPRAEDSPGYVSYRAFLEAGFKMGVDLFSQPIYKPNEDERTPIFHEKAVVFENGNAPKRLLISSANAAPNPRVNRTLEIVDADIAGYYLDHVRDLITIFTAAEPKPIREVAVRAPLKVTYGDGTSIRVSFTDGKYNPNDNIVNVLRNQHLSRVVMSHFAFTYDKMAGALAENLQMISPEARATLLLDDKFTDLVSWGVGLTLKGAMTASPPFEGRGDNRLLFPRPKDVSEKIDLFVYQRPAVENGRVRPETDEDGPPLARHVNHEKTTILIDSNQTAYVSFGSFNASGNFHNADVQLDIQVPEKSWVARGFVETIDGLIAKERSIYAVPSLVATARNAIGMMTGHTDVQVPVSDAEAFIEAIWSRDLKAVGLILARSLARPITLTNAPAPAELGTFVGRFLGYLRRHGALLVRGNEEQLIKLFSMVPVLTDQKLTPYARFSLVETTFFGLVQPDEKRAEVTRETLALFGKTPPAAKTKREKKPVVISAFDWDNTVMTMPTKIRLFQRGGTDFEDVSTEEFAHVRQLLGAAGTPFAEWEFKYPESFTQFRAPENWRDGYFIPHLEEALRAPDGRAGAFDAFVQALSSKDTAKNTHVVTARGHSVQEMIMGLVLFRQVVEKELFERYGKKVTLWLPPRANFHAMSDAGDKISEAKAERLDQIVSRAFRFDDRAEFRFYEDDVETRRVVEARLARFKGRATVIDPATLTCQSLLATP